MNTSWDTVTVAVGISPAPVCLVPTRVGIPPVCVGLSVVSVGMPAELSATSVGVIVFRVDTASDNLTDIDVVSYSDAVMIVETYDI